MSTTTLLDETILSRKPWVRRSILIMGVSAVEARPGKLPFAVPRIAPPKMCSTLGSGLSRASAISVISIKKSASCSYLIHFDKVKYNDLSTDFLTDYRINREKSLEWAEISSAHLKKFFDGYRVTEITTSRIGA
jgi:hypothetical protein